MKFPVLAMALIAASCQPTFAADSSTDSALRNTVLFPMRTLEVCVRSAVNIPKHTLERINDYARTGDNGEPDPLRYIVQLPIALPIGMAVGTVEGVDQSLQETK